jgi:hypothetical protein
MLRLGFFDRHVRRLLVQTLTKKSLKIIAFKGEEDDW